MIKLQHFLLIQLKNMYDTLFKPKFEVEGPCLTDREEATHIPVYNILQK